MGNIAKNVHSKFGLDATRNDGALGFFQTASPPNNNNNNKKKKKKKISSVWGPVPGPKTPETCTFKLTQDTLEYEIEKRWKTMYLFNVVCVKYRVRLRKIA